MRVTSHNARFGKKGTFSAKHNDRNFDISTADHIDQEKTSKNWYWHLYSKKAPNLSFEDAEAKFYAETFKSSLTAKNTRYRLSGHPERIKTMDEYRQNKLTCPEETILQVGKTGETIDPVLLQKMYVEHANWEMKTFPNVKLLNAALHVDEQGAPHLHERRVWVAHSRDGLIVGQAKALEEMGIQRPHPNKPKTRYNNAKITYTKACRDHWIEVCQKHGLTVEKEPERASKRGLELEEYKRRQEQEKTERAIQEAAQARQEVEMLKALLQEKTKEKEKLESEVRAYALEREEQITYKLLKDFTEKGKTKNANGDIVHMASYWDKFLEHAEKMQNKDIQELRELQNLELQRNPMDNLDAPELY